MVSKTVFIVGCMFVFCRLVSPQTFRPYEEQASLGGKMCPVTDVLFSVQITTRGDDGLVFCTERCSNSDGCVSIFYDNATKTCTGCSGYYDVSSPLGVSIGTVHYLRNNKGNYQQSCLPNNVCREPNQECFTAGCICSPGYSYNQSTKACVGECDVYGTTFEMYPNSHIHRNNMYALVVNLTDCLSACISEPQCLSVDFNDKSSSPCKLQAVTALTAPFLYDSNTVYYNRNCA